MNNGIFKFKVFRRRSPACRAVALVSAFAMLHVAALPAYAATKVLDNEFGGASFNYIKGGTYTSGEDGFNHGTFNTTGSALIDWQALNVGQGQGINFEGNQFFNVVSGEGASKIAGELNASGSLWIFNPAGISLMNGSQVNVGGLFSVAAAALANKDDIEAKIDGGQPVPIPLLATSEASVAVEAGAKFIVGKDMLLAGKSVTVEPGADFNKVGALKIGAGNQIDIDDVADGKVTIKITDFADNDDDINVTIGAIALGDETHAGDLEVLTEGSIVVNGAATAKGDVVFTTVAKDDAAIDNDGHKEITVESEYSVQGKSVSFTAAGDVVVEDKAAVIGENGVTFAAGNEVFVGRSDVPVDGNSAVVKAGKFEWAGGNAAPEIAETDNANMSITAGDAVRINPGAALGASGTMSLQANG